MNYDELHKIQSQFLTVCKSP